MNPRACPVALSAALLLSFATLAAEPTAPAAEPAKATADAAREPEARVSRTQHQVRIDGQVVRYTATGGWMIMKDDAGKPIARLVPLEAAPKKRRLGLFKGKLNVPDNFDAPLTEGELALFEGR